MQNYLSHGLCSFSIPADIRSILRDEYMKYDLCQAHTDEFMELVRHKVLSMEWETSDASLPGTEMLRILTSAPQIGEVTAITWLTHIITPRRFSNAKAVAAYCGLDPSLKVSAKHVTGTVKRGGCKELHKALTASSAAIRKCLANGPTTFICKPTNGRKLLTQLPRNLPWSCIT